MTEAVTRVEVVPILSSTVGDRLTENAARVIVTVTSTVAVADAESVTVQRNVAERASPAAIVAAVKVVAAVAALTAVIAPPETCVQA